MRRLYETRSRAEHLHQGILDDASENERDRRMMVFRESCFLEELSRRCISRFLTNSGLWPHFATDDALKQFWGSLSIDRRRELWGEPFDVEELRRRFDEQWVSEIDLGLKRRPPVTR